MRVIVNEPLIKKNGSRAQRAVTLGMFLLFAALLLSFNMRYILIAYIILLVGMVVLNWGASRATKWLRKPRADQELGKALKGLDQGYRLYSYILPAEHALTSPGGLYAIRVKPHDGSIKCQGDRWHRQFTFRRLPRLLAEERLGNPSRQAQSDAEELRRFVADRLPGVDVDVQPLVVFSDPQVELELFEPVVPVLRMSELKAHLRDSVKARHIPQETLRALNDTLDEQAS